MKVKLVESVQNDIIESFKLVEASFENLKDKCRQFSEKCTENKNLKFEAEYLNDFCGEEFYDKLKATKEAILDEYYPIDYADDEEDHLRAGERYRDSKELRNSIFGD